MGRGGTAQTKTKNKKGERDYTDEALALLNHLKPLMNLWRALMSTLDTEFKPSKKPLTRLVNLNLLRTGQLQRTFSIVSNSSSSQHTLGYVPDPREPTTNLKLALSKPSSQHVLILSIAAHRHLETQQPGPFPQHLCFL